MEVCPDCGMTGAEQEFHKEQASALYRENVARWEQHHDPNEPKPGFPLTYEDRVHSALALYYNDTFMDPTVMAINRAAQIAEVDYKDVVRALDHTNGTNKSKPGLALSDKQRIRYAFSCSSKTIRPRNQATRLSYKSRENYL
jgi:hypothetical protein